MKVTSNTVLLLLSATATCLMTVVLGSLSDSYKLRLVQSGSSSNKKEGRLEIKYKGQWGTVCNHGWTDTHASVACRSMGLRGGKVTTSTPGTGMIWLDGVRCKAHHWSLSECCHNEFGVHDCTHNDDVAIMCQENAGNNGYGAASHLPQPYVPNNDKDKTLPHIEPNGPPSREAAPTRAPQGRPKAPDTIYPSDFNGNKAQKPNNQVWPGRSDPRVPPPEPPHPDPAPGQPNRPSPKLPNGAVVIGGPGHNRAAQGAPGSANRETRTTTTRSTVIPSVPKHKGLFPTKASKLTDGQALWSCNFDDGTECNVYVQDKYNRWNARYSRSAGIKDHTTGGEKGAYKVVHTEHRTSQEGILNTPTNDKSYALCLTVWYYINSVNNQDAELAIFFHPGSPNPLWKRTVPGTQWGRAIVTMPYTGRHYNAVIKGKAKNGATVAIDDLVVYKAPNGDCSTLYS